ncbi:MAG: GNAT family N-acetyltransferase [Rhodothermales bacterium]
MLDTVLCVHRFTPTPFMSDQITIRPLRAEDPPRIAAAFAAIGWDKPVVQYERYLAEQAAGRRQVFVGELDHHFAGYTTLNWHPNYPPFQEAGLPEIQDLNVLPAFRKRGLGKALVLAAEQAAAERCTTIGIGVGLYPDYGSAHRLYVRLGYLPDGRGIAYEDRIVAPGEQVRVDDGLVLHFTKAL